MVLLKAGDHEAGVFLRWSSVRSSFGSTILLVAGAPFWLRILCMSVALRALPTKGWAEVPLEYIETPSIEVMMVVGAPWRCFSDRKGCWLACSLRLMRARWLTDCSSQSAEVQSLASVLAVVISLLTGCWTCCATFGEGKETGEEDLL